MLRNFFVLVVVTSFGLFLYGIKNVYHDVEPNACRMTYMFAQPQFSRVNIEDEKKFPSYGVYYYHEGPFSKNVNKLKLSGAPVIFVPGNGGSLKQVRSLASVALRKSIDNKSDIKLDYFTIDYNEELSGVYGQYLPDQVKFLDVSIKSVLKLYKDAYTDNRKVVLIGHSMGGKIAQTVITNPDIASKINSVICISSPLDIPVIKLDASTQDFYVSSEAKMSKIRTSYLPSDKTNHCCNKTSINLKGFDNTQATSTKDVQNILFVSIGGGNRDVLVREGLTTSKYSDIHALTASIPKVWLSCDHLSSVWCLQLMLVVNRFLFDISKVFEFKYTLFKEDWNTRLRAANNHLRVGRTTSRPTLQKIEFDDDISHIVHEDSRRIYGRQVPNDSKKFYNEIFQLKKLGKYRKLYIDVFNYEKNDWLYGCSTNSDDVKSKICSNASSLSHYIEEIPSKGRVRSIARLDIQSIKKTYTNWSHLVIRLPPSTKHVYFNVDIHEPSVRYFEIAAPRWYSMKNHIVVNESVHGTIHYKLHFQGLTESFLGLKVMIEPQACLQKSFSLTTKMCVPWAYGFDKYQVLSESTPAHIFVAVPFSPPKNYNASKNPVDFDIFLDPACRFRISYSFSMAHTMSRIFKEYYSWLPAHIVSVLIIVLKNQMATLAKAGSKKSPFPYSGFFQFKSIYIITGCRVVKKLITPIEFLPTTSDTSNSYYVLAIVHSTAIVLSIMIAFLLWAVTLCNSNLWHRFMLRLTRITFINSNILMVVLNQLPMAVGVVTVSIAFGACSGVALFFACGFYLITLSSAHKDYLEKWVWKKATNLLKGKRNTQVEQQSTETENVNEATEKDESKDGNGLSHFSFYFVIFLLLLVIALINIPMTIAWVKNRSSTVVLPDSALFSTILILCSLAILHQLNAPNELILNKLVAVFLYAAASASVLFCQQEIHRLNNVVAFVLVVLAVQEVLGSIYRYCIKK